MIKKQINQNDILNSELLNIMDYYYSFNNKPIQRIETKPTLENTLVKLKILKKKIEDIKDCDLKNNAKQIVFNDGNSNSPVMIVGEGPGQKEDEIGKPFVGDAGILLDKMLEAININRQKIYITNVVNYRPPENRKPDKIEINKYSIYLKEHISIINPKILILMGSTAMEALFGNNNKISQERGKWKEVIIGHKSYKTIVTFHPAYLLRKPEQKKFSWEDLKIIRKEIDQQNIEF